MPEHRPLGKDEIKRAKKLTNPHTIKDRLKIEGGRPAFWIEHHTTDYGEGVGKLDKGFHTFLNLDKKLVAVVHHRIDGGRTLMVPHNAEGRLEYFHNGEVHELLPGQAMDLDPSRQNHPFGDPLDQKMLENQAFREDVQPINAQPGERGIRFDFMEASLSGSKRGPSYNISGNFYDKLTYAWHPSKKKK